MHNAAGARAPAAPRRLTKMSSFGDVAKGASSTHRVAIIAVCCIGVGFLVAAAKRLSRVPSLPSTADTTLQAASGALTRAVTHRSFLTGPLPRIALLGDSLTQQSFGNGGWGGRISDLYSRRADVVNRGFSGYNSRWFLLSLPSILDSLSGGPPPALYTVMLGGNDCALPAVSNRQAVPLDDFKANINSIVKQIQAWHQQQRARHSGPGEACRIVLMATPPVADSKWLAHEAGMKAKSKGPSDPSRLNTVTGQYAAAMIEVAVALGLPYVDNWNSLQQQAKADGAGLDDILSDGLHLAPAGQEMLYNALLSTVKVSFPDLFVDPAMTKEKFGLKPLLPWHDAFSRDSPGDAL